MLQSASSRSAIRWLTVLVAAVLFAAVPPAAAQSNPAAGTISGRVVDASSLRPLEGAVVRLQLAEANSETLRATAADAAGGTEIVDHPRLRAARPDIEPTLETLSRDHQLFRDQLWQIVLSPRGVRGGYRAPR